MDERVVEQAVGALRAGQPVVLPTDTVYGLCADPDRAEPVQRLYELKGRVAKQPTALVAADVERLFERVPELRGRAILTGPFTLILPNPAKRYSWLTGDRPETIGVRVPELSGPGRAVLDAVGAIAATSANLPGRPGSADARRGARRDPRGLRRPRRRRRAAGHAVDGDRPHGNRADGPP